MKEIVVLSGKGGTGKTAVLASFAALAENSVLCDCDVDAPNLHLLLEPEVLETHDFYGLQVAHIDPEACNECGLCGAACRFDAIRDFQVDPFACEGCGLCTHVCPLEAISMRDRLAGHWYVSRTRFGLLTHARLRAAQENSGKLVMAVRKRAREIAAETGAYYILSDGPPGIGCPAISSLSGAQTALIVTEPSLSGIHDLERVLELCRHFRVRALVCMNKCDLSAENSQRIEEQCRRLAVEVVARIPFDPDVNRAIVEGRPVVETSDGAASREIRSLWEAVAAHPTP
ncbi:MAG: ATP-binding protein [Dehalococcoidia bacterium]|nr:ATP-binding protein [Dehalococcoidia bacterium]